LVFFGLVGDTTDDWFDGVRFVMQQQCQAQPPATGTVPCGPGQVPPPQLIDQIGIDSIIVGQSLRQPGTGGTVPTPGTLALAGLALPALGALTRRRARSA
jgi:hypothetical protein